MINAIQLRINIIRPVLESLNSFIPYSLAAENLLMGTCAQESRMGSYVHQVNGPALGIFQMEPETEADIWANYLGYRTNLSKFVDRLCIESDCVDDLIGSMPYAVAMARIHYYRAPSALPDADSVGQMANYWKLVYNTPEGKGTEAEFIHNYNRYVA